MTYQWQACFLSLTVAVLGLAYRFGGVDGGVAMLFTVSSTTIAILVGIAFDKYVLQRLPKEVLPDASRRSGREGQAKGGPKHERRSGKAGQPRRYEEAMAQRADDKNKALAEAEAEAERAARRALPTEAKDTEGAEGAADPPRLGGRGGQASRNRNTAAAAAAAEDDTAATTSYDPREYQPLHPDDRGGGGHGKPAKKTQKGSAAMGKGKGKGKGNEDGDGAHRCGNCDAPEAKLKCKGCGVEHYCNRECQTVGCHR